MAAIIIKFRKKPAKIEGYEALLKRLPLYHPKQELVEDFLKSSKAGFGGEERLDQLMKYFSPDYPYLIIQDYSISSSMELQVDTILLTQSCIILLEVKNISGRLRFTLNPSTLRQTTASGIERGYKSPLVQMEMAKWKFANLLKSIDISLPVHAFLVIAYPNQIVEDSPPGSIIWSADEVMIRLQNFKMPPEIISIDEMHRLGQQLLSLYSEYNPFPLAPKIGINPDEIKNGVFCPACEITKMNKIKRSWKCEGCGLTNPEAHHQALHEWFMLIKPSITVAECKDFLELEHLSSARRILSHPFYKKASDSKVRRYYMDKHVGIHEK
ncbi:nuclease-related domain-containing protein [Metaplanococcus flavidus]|uniref:Nuclease-related domain-containing protein n=1 Tax=Metaplanococcus flavidus TaxID=569883 RepID=A0ABW3LBX2_9BACL